MHEIARLILVLVAGLVLSAAPASAQPRTTKTTILSAVMQYRLHWIGDSTAFDSCRVFRAAGEPADFPAGIMQPVRRLLDRRADPCSRTTPSSPSRHRVVVDSVTTSDSLAYVFLTVHRGERTHRENYTVRTPPSQPGFAGVRSVTLWGAVQSHRGMERERRSGR